MITIKALRRAVNTKLKETGFKVIQSDVKEGFKRPSFFVAYGNVKKSDSGTELYKRDLEITIRFFPESRDKYTDQCYDMMESLEYLFDSTLQVEDRYLSIDEVDSGITDGVLHFSFSLSFYEARETGDTHDLMGVLEFRKDVL